MKHLSLISLLAALTLMCGCAPELPPVALFENDLSNAQQAEAWSVDKDGVLSATADKTLFTKNQYENFILSLEFKAGEKSNAGVVLYCTQLEDWPAYSLEVQLCDNKTAGENAWARCGAIFGHVAPAKEIDPALNEWHKLTILAKGKLVKVWIDDKLTTRMDMAEWTSLDVAPDGTTKIPAHLAKQKKADMPTKGFIGLQGLHGKGEGVVYRNIVLHPLPTGKTAKSLEEESKEQNPEEL